MHVYSTDIYRVRDKKREVSWQQVRTVCSWRHQNYSSIVLYVLVAKTSQKKLFYIVVLSGELSICMSSLVAMAASSGSLPCEGGAISAGAGKASLAIGG